MSNPIIESMEIGGITIEALSGYEMRLENDLNGNPLFVAHSPIPNADPAEPVWMIRKLHYDANSFLVRQQQPDGQPKHFKFAYVWDDRETYFS